MFNLDPDHLPPEIASLVLTRGRGVPPLLWDAQPNRVACRTLTEIDNAKLFQRMGLANEAMANAVRALLLFWNGLPVEAKAALEGAPEAERDYISAIIARQAGNVDEAKELMRRVGVHCTHQALASGGIKLLVGMKDQTMARLSGIVRQTNQWESFLFLDVFERARTGQMKEMAAQTVCKLQCLEFELLLRHCCETALGEKLSMRPDAGKKEQENRLQHMRKLVERHKAISELRRHWRDELEPKEEEEKEEEAPVPEERIKIGCPKCKHAVDVPVSARGRIAKCDRCGVAFMIPGVVGGVLNANAPTDLIGIRCPKCREMLMFPESVRGQKQKCVKCGVVFLVPQKKPAAAEPAGA